MWVISISNQHVHQIFRQALRKDADMVLLGDLAGRRAAMMQGLNVMGTLGFLKAMNRKGRIKNFKDVLDCLQKYGFWMNTDLYKRMLED